MKNYSAKDNTSLQPKLKVHSIMSKLKLTENLVKNPNKENAANAFQSKTNFNFWSIKIKIINK